MSDPAGSSHCGEGRRQLAYEATRAQRHLIAVDPIFAGSRRCARCHGIHRALGLERRPAQSGQDPEV